ncbi:unnamed protein product [Candidula unifasciata]|uniref:C2H2-type domain-containing protein n=1 Tax=Candidula unifasciata TaxID=100452 RepID=A0A8S3ZQ03_9EUPU|nr:unnamed protein product [Candidula unifasciata]
MPELQMDVAVANRFISSLSKSLQALCHGCMDFDSGIEIVGYINVNIDSGSKVDYVLNEKVLKSTTNSMTFVSNSFLAKKEQQKQTRDGACSPIPDQQPPVLPQYQNRFRGSFHGPHPRNMGQMSFAQRGSQKRSWPGMERDWRMSPKKQREGRLPHESSATTSPGAYPHLVPSASSQSPADGSFKYPQTSGQSSETNTSDDRPEINIKKEIFDNDSEKTSQNDHDPSQISDQETNEYLDEASKTNNIRIKNDPDAITSAAEDESHASEGAGNHPDTDFKGTFLDPAVSEDNPDNTEENKHETDENIDDHLGTSRLTGKASHDLEADNEDQSEATEDITAENAAMGSEMPADYDEAGEEGTYPQSVYSDAGEGSSDTGQFEVIEIDDEDEDVQAMFGGSRDIQDNTFDFPKHLGSHGLDSHTRIRFSQTVDAAHWSHIQDAQSDSFHSFDFKPVKIPSKEDCRFDPVTHRYICPACNSSYLTYASMCGHIKLKHQGRYEIHCEICGKGFQRKIHLLGHMAMHGQPMNFECSVCGAKYAHKTSLRAHERLSHGIVQ